MCNICKHIPCHSQCPNYERAPTDMYCDICRESIYHGDEYVENKNGDYRHYDCFYSMRELLEWLGYDIKTKEEL